MTATTYQILYVVERALENAADQPDIRPVRVYRLAFPLHVAEVSATVTAREPFDLLDRYVGLAIADGGFRSVADIARYLGVTEHIVRRVLLFLIEIRHVTGADGVLALTELGQRAVRDDTRYIPKEDRLKLYFDGVRCAPLPSKYYSRSVRVLSRDDALNQHQFGLLNHTGEFNTASVAALARRRDRADYNLPDEHENLTVRTVGRAFLPCYLIRARMRSGYRSLAYTAADPFASDSYLEGIMRGWPDLDQVMRAEDNTDAAMREELTTWLDERGLSTTQLSWDGYDVPRLTLPARHFPTGDAPVRNRGEFPLRQVGSYVTPQSFVVQLWCTDPETRREAALQRALEYADVIHRNETAIAQFLEQISTRLAVEPELSVSDLRAYARRTGRGVLGI
jgi:hypothetical protein